MNEEIIDVGDGSDFYENTQQQPHAIIQQPYQQRTLIPKIEYQQVAQSSTYYVQRIQQAQPMQQQFSTPGRQQPQLPANTVDYPPSMVLYPVLRILTLGSILGY